MRSGESKKPLDGRVRPATDLSRGGRVFAEQDAYLGVLTVLTTQSAEVARQAYEAEWNRLNLARTLSIGASFAALALAATARAPATRSGH